MSEWEIMKRRAEEATAETKVQHEAEKNSHCESSTGSAGTESDEAWRLYVLENHILQDDESESDAANYWHKLDDETQDRYLQRIRDSKQNTERTRERSELSRSTALRNYCRTGRTES